MNILYLYAADNEENVSQGVPGKKVIKRYELILPENIELAKPAVLNIYIANPAVSNIYKVPDWTNVLQNCGDVAEPLVQAVHLRDI